MHVSGVTVWIIHADSISLRNEYAKFWCISEFDIWSNCTFEYTFQIHITNTQTVNRYQ